MTDRPHPYGEAVASLLADILLARVVDWTGESSLEPEDRMAVYGALLEAVELEDDAFTLAKALDELCGIGADTALVQAFADLPLLRAAVTDRLVKAWVRAMRPACEFQPGSQVVLSGEPETIYTVLEVDLERARYRIVQGVVPAAQLAEAQATKSSGKRRASLVPFEDVYAHGLPG